MPKAKVPTDKMLADLRAAEEVLDVLDQHARPRGDDLPRFFAQLYDKLETRCLLEVTEWNAEVAANGADPESGAYGGSLIYRCSLAGHYVTTGAGRCGIYTTHAEGILHLCEMHQSNPCKCMGCAGKTA